MLVRVLFTKHPTTPIHFYELTDTKLFILSHMELSKKITEQLYGSAAEVPFRNF